MPLAEWLVNNRNLFLTVLEIEKSKIKLLIGSVPGENPISGSFLICSTF